MTYNIHPIFVHFPIAFLILYSVIHLIPFRRWLPRISWKQIELALLAAGFLGALIASETGEIAEHLVRPQRDLVEAHATFASLTIWFYGLILLGEVLRLALPFIETKIRLPQWLSSTIRMIEKILTQPGVSGVLAFLGLVAISLTGLLGGVMVYGTTADPFAAMILKILGISL